ncbi:hypothetical protein NK8_71810 (plasmid) [Caballeronia sp. NK8]|uniref:hypothetical protein n=1 Tax=Caballeronia sp. NK8 TaxID=140098 RepID=UPI001BB5EF7E|nr:hypothetical protein [Caballeronia sp. NK8]BCQ28991.1 hypothetical protein NK8_71810 [Caballeronia sp. NK8]
MLHDRAWLDVSQIGYASIVDDGLTSQRAKKAGFEAEAGYDEVQWEWKIMGLGMQIAYQGFVGTNDAERAAGVELVRLERAAKDIANCHLTIEAYLDQSGGRRYDARLDLVTRDFDLIPIERATDPDVDVAIHQAFDNAMRYLQHMRFSST